MLVEYAQKLAPGTTVRVQRAGGPAVRGTLMKATNDAIVVQPRTRIPEPAIEIPTTDILGLTPETGNGGHDCQGHLRRSRSRCRRCPGGLPGAGFHLRLTGLADGWKREEGRWKSAALAAPALKHTLYHLPSTIYHSWRMIPPVKKLGLLAILFFTVKGLLWLIVPFVIYKWGC